MYAQQIEVYRKVQSSNTTSGRIEAAALTQSSRLSSNFQKNWEAPRRPAFAPQVEAYKTVQNATASGREIEAGALARCALMLSDCRENWDAPDREEKLAEALRTNQQIWSILQSELTQRDNPLPKSLKENILSLSVFIDKRIIEIMAYPAPEKLKILIDINLNLAAGLRSKAAE